MCDFDILSQGHALRDFDNLADFSLEIEGNPHKYEHLPYLPCFVLEKLILADTNMCLCVILTFCPRDMLCLFLVI